MSSLPIHSLSKAKEAQDAGYLARCLCNGVLSSIPVSSGFYVDTSMFKDFKSSQTAEIASSMLESIKSGISDLEKELGSTVEFGNTRHPLLLDIRADVNAFSWSPLPSVEFVGFNDAVAFEIAKQTGDRGLAYNAYRRFISSYSAIVLGIPVSVFDQRLIDYCRSRGILSLSEFSGSDWVEITKHFKSIVMKRSGVPFPQDPAVQLKRSIEAVYRSYLSLQQKYGSFYESDISLVVLQSKYGFSGYKSFSCSLSSRDSEDGSPYPSGIIGMNCSLEDVKRGLCRISTLEWDRNTQTVSCAVLDNEVVSKIINICRECEGFFGSPCSVDIIVDEESISVVNIYRAPLKGGSIFRAVYDMVNNNVITKNAAIKSLCYEDVCELSSLRAHPGDQAPIGYGIGSGQGSIIGRVCYSRESVEKCHKEGDNAVYFCRRIYPDDMVFLPKVAALVSTDGSQYSAESLFCRTDRKPSSIGFRCLTNGTDRVCITDANEFSFTEGDTVTVSGEGNVYAGALPLVASLSNTDKAASSILSWADEIRHNRFDVFVDVPDIESLKSNVGIGENGIGCIPFESLLRGKRGEVLLAFLRSGSEKYATALEAQLVKDISNLLVSRRGTTVCIRLLEDISKLQPADQSPQDQIRKEDFPGLLNRRVLQLQARSISGGTFSAKRKNANVHVRVLVPSIIDSSEIQVVNSVFNECDGCKPLIGGELCTVRSCLVSDHVLKYCDFVEIDVPRIIFSGCFDNLSEMIPLIKSCSSSRNEKEVGIKGVSRGDDLEVCVRSGVTYCVVGSRDVSAARICSARALV